MGPISKFIKHNYRHFNAASLVDAAEGYKKHIDEGGKMMITLAGAMRPVTIAGALAQQHAEAIAGIALAEIVKPGAPVMYGGFTSNVDMRTGAPAFGTPEYMKATIVGGQLARRYRIPFRTSNTCAASSASACMLDSSR